MKLVMPNPYSVYMHDTPSKQLFDEPVRAFSHGCVRTDDAIGYAATLLDGVMTRGRVDTIVALGVTTTLNHQECPFDPTRIDAIILTHAHIDHSGLLPQLVARGFTGDVWCTQETIDLLEHMLADSGRIHEFEAERRNRRSDRAGDEPFIPLYTERQAMFAWERCRPVPLQTWFEHAPGFRARL